MREWMVEVNRGSRLIADNRGRFNARQTTTIMRSKNYSDKMRESEVNDEPNLDANTPDEQSRRTRYLLSLNGGGVRGLASRRPR
jgi:hypothetical protein